MKTYAGIGSRETPADIQLQMYEIAKYLDSRDYVLRSGGAAGADTAFSEGAKAGFNKHEQQIFKASHATDASILLAAKFHPNWNACTPSVRKLHGRNAMIILGRNLDDRVDFVICWTKNGSDIGGTGLGMRIAQERGIPIYNLFHEQRRDLMDRMVKNNSML